METLFLFGGTSEGHILAETAWKRWKCHVFVATPEGAAVLPNEIAESERTHIGRLDAAQMAEQMRLRKPAFVLDATHPYAVEVSANIQTACAAEQIKYLRVLRESIAYEGCMVAENAQEACESLIQNYATQPVLLTTGSKELPVFTALTKHNPEVYARILPGEANEAIALQAGIAQAHILTGLGPFSEEENRKVLREFNISVLVTKESGSRGGFAEKIGAAKKEGADVIVIRRPAQEQGITLEEAVAFLEAGEN